MTLEEMKTKFAGKRVQFIGMTGTADGPTGKVWRITKSGVWVTFPDGRQQVHPDDLRVVPNA